MHIQPLLGAGRPARFRGPPACSRLEALSLPSGPWEERGAHLPRQMQQERGGQPVTRRLSAYVDSPPSHGLYPHTARASVRVQPAGRWTVYVDTGQRHTRRQALRRRACLTFLFDLLLLPLKVNSAAF